MRINILITTTSTIENASIEKYIELISSNVVIGTNLFSDFAASFSDTFGGFSGTYQNKLQKIYNTAIKELKEKAFDIGANAVIGLKIDFDEITGAGKSMFMVSAVGTAVKISINNTHSDIITSNISSVELNDEITKRNIIDILKSDQFPIKEHWEYLRNNNNNNAELSILLLEKHLKIWNKSEAVIYERGTLLNNNISTYFRTMDRDTAIEYLYSSIAGNEIPIIKIITNNNLFSAKHIIDLIKNNHISATIQCLTTNKECYCSDDLNQMIIILELLEKLPDLGKIELTKGLLSKGKEKYCCPNGHFNDKEDVFCFICNLNIKGLTPNDIMVINNFKLKVDSLKHMLTTK